MELRESRGLSLEQVPWAMLRAGIDRDKIPSARTIRRVEQTGRMPRVGHAFAIAAFYDVELHRLWPVRMRQSRFSPEAGQRQRVAAA